MKTIYSKIMLLVLIIALALGQSGCLVAWDPPPTYLGDQRDLATAVLYSIPGMDSGRGDQFYILEKDEYGRILCAAFLEDGKLIKDSFSDIALVILVLQNVDDDSVQFYPEKNYILKLYPESVSFTAENISEYFTEEEIEQIKTANNWDCPNLDEVGACLTVLIPEGPGMEKDVFLTDAMENVLESQIGTNFRSSFFREDAQGNQIFYIMNICASGEYEWYLAAFNSDGTLLEGGIRKLPMNTATLAENVSEYLDKIAEVA